MSILRRGGVAVVAALGLVVSAGAVSARAVPAPGGDGALEGFWRTVGYRQIVAIQDGRLRTYDTTAVSCLPGSTTGTRVGRVGPGGEVRFAVGGAVEISVRPSGHGALMRFADAAPADIGMRRMTRLPARCSRPMPKDPLTVFDVFWQTYQENYPFFALKGIDWRAARRHYRPMVGHAPLFDILRAMIEPLHDAHTALSTTGDQEHCSPATCYLGMRPGSRPLDADLRARVEAIIAAELKPATLHSEASGLLEYAVLPGRLGYLRIRAFTNYTKAGTYPADSRELRRVLDALLTTGNAKDLRGLIVDLRPNAGGSDRLGLQVAERLTDRPYLAYSKRTYLGSGRYTAPQPIWIRPAPDRSHYTGPIAVLTAGSTLSAGETFTQALMGRTPRPVRIGENTQGVFSDTLDRSLPNGWIFELPNEQYLTATGQAFDGAGIPPDIATPVFTDTELGAGRDSALERARELLAR